MFKRILQEYAAKNSYLLPVYKEEIQGPVHDQKFKCTVTINGTTYESPTGSTKKKEAHNAAAKAAVEDLKNRGLLPDFEATKQDSNQPKNILVGLASSKGMSSPSYSFTVTVKVNEKPYIGDPSNNHKEAENNAARKAIKEIDPQYYNSLFPGEVDANNDSKQLMSDINDAHSVPATQPHNDTEQDPFSAQHEHLKRETGDTDQDKEHGSKGTQQISQGLDLTESTSKRSRSESDNAEQISEINKKNRTETDSTS